MATSSAAESDSRHDNPSSSTLEPDSYHDNPSSSTLEPDSHHDNHSDDANSVPTVVLAKKECPFCHNDFSTFQKARQHISSKHGRMVETRSKKDHSKLTVYNAKNANMYREAGVNVVVKLSCMSCTMVFSSKQELAAHVDAVHILARPSIDGPPADAHWILEGVDITSKLAHYRQSCMEKLEEEKTWMLDTHLIQILLLSGIILLQKRYDYQCIPEEILGPLFLQSMRNDIISCYNRVPFNPDLFIAISNILHQYSEEQIDDTRAQIDLLSLVERANVDEAAVIKAIVALIPNLYDHNVTSISEAHLVGSYIHPFIHGLLSTKTPTSIAHCSNNAVDDNDTVMRPDYEIDVYSPGYYYRYTNGYGEVKTNASMSPTLLIKDMYRLALFAKTGIDKFNLDSLLAFQTVGNSITFFAMSLTHDQIYTFTELVRVKVPTKINEILDLVGQLGNLAFVSSVHKNHCVPSGFDLSARKYPTLPDGYVDKNTLAPRKRQHVLTLDQ